MTLAQDLAALATPPIPTMSVAMKGFEPGVQYVDGRPDIITSPRVFDEASDQEDYERVVAGMGVPVPDGWALQLVEARFDPVAWTREEMFVDDERSEEPGARTKAPAVTRPAWRYRWRLVPDFVTALRDADFDKLQRMAKASGRGRPVVPKSTKTTAVIDMADFQFGKVDVRGGTPELLERIEIAKLGKVAWVRKHKPAEIILLDGGDMMEGFESAPGSDRTNDLSQVQQLRIMRRVMWDWIATFAKLTDDLKVVGVPSNHCRVRRGKETMGSPGDDYGIENIIACSDIAAANTTGAYDHVQFIVPTEYDEAVAFPMVGGKIFGAIHGHQFGSPEKAGDWLAKMALGRRPIGYADMVFVHHYHQFRQWTVGDDRWLFMAPTSDSGSSWFSNNQGSESRPGVMSVLFDETGWIDVDVAWSA